ncbi:MarR family transcriptional regulator [Nocardia sp. NBC_01730]|uniref:MarR family transcriptional regulator n=1 Tax=Nocardia sp. NBC_01730 TaxID=2975998 RepID=UPI002E1102EC|nr:MarR family transcriptional regulator [Nocardia sp. NBC_01730]
MNLRTLLLGVAIMITMPLAACGGQSNESAQPKAATGADAADNRLIGYQVKRLDQLIELTFDRLISETGLTRRQWQTLNTIGRGAVDDAQLVDALRPFWEANKENVDEVVADLAVRGWVERGPDGKYALTAAGRTAHAAAAETVGRIRELSAAGISDQEFAQMMDVMRRIIANLE